MLFNSESRHRCLSGPQVGKEMFCLNLQEGGYWAGLFKIHDWSCQAPCCKNAFIFCVIGGIHARKALINVSVCATRTLESRGPSESEGVRCREGGKTRS